jgi:hypothetical protein
VCEQPFYNYAAKQIPTPFINARNNQLVHILPNLALAEVPALPTLPEETNDVIQPKVD